MTTERRTDARGKASARVTFTDATSDTPNEGILHDIGRGGMFIATKTLLPAGKRIDVEVLGQPVPITGMARVIWVREAAQGDLPMGIGIKFIDVDDTALNMIDKLVGLKKNVRERTVLGMAAPKVEVPKPDATVKVQVAVPPEARPEVPKVEAPKPLLKSRERTVLGVAPPQQPREKELSWDDVPAPEPVAAAPAPVPVPVKKEASAPTLTVGEASLSEPVNFSEPGLVLPKEEPKAPEPEPMKEPEPVREPEPEPSREPEPVPLVAKAVEPAPAPTPTVEPSMPEPRELPKRESGGAGKWIVLLLLLGLGAGAAYFFRDKIFPPPQLPPTPSATASASAAPSASASAMPSATVAETTDAATTAVDAAAEDASALATATLDAGPKDAGHDAARHHDAGHDGGPHHVHPKPSATATGNDNPY
jgi:hypothetical protein